MEDAAQLSKEEKEAFINAKMEQIRKKNEELLKRHKEVEADKKNAEEFSKAALEHKTTSHAHIDRKPPARNYTPKVRQPRPPHEEQAKLPDHTESRRQQQRLQDGDGPPPDPVYSFLSDRTREGQLSDGQRGQSRRHVGNFGGPDFTNVRSTMQHSKTRKREMSHYPPRNKMEMALYMTGRERREYQQWREERNKVEEERLARQKTASGQWRREWDRAKDEQSEMPRQSPEYSDALEHRGNARRQLGTGRDQDAAYQRQRVSRPNDSPDLNPAFIGDFEKVSIRPRSDGSRGFRGPRASNSSQSEDEKVSLDDQRPARSNYLEDRAAVKDKVRVKSRDDKTVGNRNLQRRSGNSDETEKVTQVLHHPVEDKASIVPVHADIELNALQDGDDDSWEDVTTSGNESTISEINIQDGQTVDESPRVMDLVTNPSLEYCSFEGNDLDLSDAKENMIHNDHCELSYRIDEGHKIVVDMESVKIYDAAPDGMVIADAIDGELQDKDIIEDGRTSTTFSADISDLRGSVELGNDAITGDCDSSESEKNDAVFAAEIVNPDNVHEKNAIRDDIQQTFSENVDNMKDPVNLEEPASLDEPVMRNAAEDFTSEIQMPSSADIFVNVNESNTTDLPEMDTVPKLSPDETLTDNEQTKEELLESNLPETTSIEVIADDLSIVNTFSEMDAVDVTVKESFNTEEIPEDPAKSSENNAELPIAVENEHLASEIEHVSDELSKASISNELKTKIDNDSEVLSANEIQHLECAEVANNSAQTLDTEVGTAMLKTD